MALARMLSNSGREVTVWSALPQEVDELSRTRRQKNLPGMVIPDEIKFTKEIAEACQDKDIILFAVPSVFVRSTAKTAAAFIPDGQIIVDVAKGIEPDTLLTLTEVIADELNKDGKHGNVHYVALSGPTHAEEVAKDLPTTIVSACEDQAVAEKVQDVFMNKNMRVYTNSDRLGVELCGALKNVIALASGMAEIKRLGLKMGGKEDSFDGLAGMGDLIVTATSKESRNNNAGYLIGKGKSAEEAKKEVGMVVEGINAIPAALELADKYDVEMPIVFAVDAVVNRGADARETVDALMLREKKSEVCGSRLLFIFSVLF